MEREKETGKTSGDNGGGKRRDGKVKDKEKFKRDENRYSHREKKLCILLQVLCSSEVRTRSLHRPTHQMSLQTQRAAKV